METQSEKVARVIREQVDVVPYDSSWPELFKQEKQHLLSLFPSGLIVRIEHFGSTAVPGLAAKSIVDMLVGVRSLERTKEEIAPVLEAQGYDYFWRPSFGDNGPPWYAWFIKRDSAGARTHHIHMVEMDFEHWERLLFRDYLIAHPETAATYQTLKYRLVRDHAQDRVAYTREKTDFIHAVTTLAKKHAENPHS